MEVEDCVHESLSKDFANSDVEQWWDAPRKLSYDSQSSTPPGACNPDRGSGCGITICRQGERDQMPR
jgi:hypothetical protein